MNDNYLHFNSDFIMGKKEYEEISSIYFQPLLLAYLLILIFTVLLTPHMTIVITLAYAFIYFLTLKRSKEAYKKAVASRGKDSYRVTMRFTDKITMATDIRTPTDYQFDQIVAIQSTLSFYVLRLKNGSFILTSKDVTAHSDSVSFLDYLFSKCVNLKKKKVKNIQNTKRYATILLVAYVVLTLIGFIPVKWFT